MLRIIGVGESKVENDILDIIDTQTNPTIATYAKGYECTLRITAKAKTVEEARALIKPMSDEMKRRFKPEFLNRVDDIIMFKSLQKEEIKKIVDEAITAHVEELHTEYVEEETPAEEPKEEPAEEA